MPSIQPIVRALVIAATLFAVGPLLAQVTTATTLKATPRATSAGKGFSLSASIDPDPGIGKVTFYDEETIIGIAPLAAASATLPDVMLLPGKHRLHALFQGSSDFSASRSNTVITLASSAPTRVLESTDEVDVSSQTVYSYPKIVTADFNHDGKLDLAFNPGSALFVALGNGDGTFQTPTQYLAVCTGGQVYDFTAMDVYGTGNLDLLVMNDCATPPDSTSMTILVGNGSGTFTEDYGSTLYSSQSIMSADFNNDGIPDVVQSGPDGGILLNDGNGNFHQTAGQISPLAASVVAVADFNRDGYLDLLFVQGNGILGVQLGDGTGNLGTAILTTPNTPAFGPPIAVDLNGDGIPDLAIPSNVGVSVYLGKGDGTFAEAVEYAALGGSGSVVAAGDFNGDGTVDLVVFQGGCPSCDAAIGLAGKGDGTFRPAVRLSDSNLYFSGSILAGTLASWNGDARLDAILSYQVTDVQVGVLPLLGMR